MCRCPRSRRSGAVSRAAKQAILEVSMYSKHAETGARRSGSSFRSVLRSVDPGIEVETAV
jgi:hypothetical protein